MIGKSCKATYFEACLGHNESASINYTIPFQDHNHSLEKEKDVFPSAL